MLHSQNRWAATVEKKINKKRKNYHWYFPATPKSFSIILNQGGERNNFSKPEADTKWLILAVYQTYCLHFKLSQGSIGTHVPRLGSPISPKGKVRRHSSYIIIVSYELPIAKLDRNFLGKHVRVEDYLVRWLAKIPLDFSHGRFWVTEESEPNWNSHHRFFC